MSFLEEMVARRRCALTREPCAMGPDGLDVLEVAQRQHIDFTHALQSQRDVAVIAEVKKASPSVGPITPGCDPVAQARAYERGGASAISVLTEPEVFRGSFSDLRSVACAMARLPVLCKDFVVDPVQLQVARAAGADAVLLMVSVLGDAVGEYVKRALALGLTPLVEVASPAELAIALAAHPDTAPSRPAIAVNARDFTTLEVSLPRQRLILREAADAGAMVIAASGISCRSDVEAAAGAGASAVLVGEALMRALAPEEVLRGLTGVGRRTGGETIAARAVHGNADGAPREDG